MFTIGQCTAPRGRTRLAFELQALWIYGTKLQMARSAPPARIRLAVDLPAETRRRVRIAAARRDLTIQEYVRRALERQIEEDAPDALHAADDPVLAELWDNEHDAAYDKL